MGNRRTLMAVVTPSLVVPSEEGETSDPTTGGMAERLAAGRESTSDRPRLLHPGGPVADRARVAHPRRREGVRR